MISDQAFAMHKVGIARLFRIGRSQAVRLPKEFTIPGDRVRIRRVNGGILLEPILDVEEWFAGLDRLATEPFMAEGRNQPEPPVRDLGQPRAHDQTRMPSA